MKKIKKVCQTCGKDFWVENYPSRLKRGPKYCSVNCRQKGLVAWIKSLPYKQQPTCKNSRVELKCKICGKKFITQKSEIKRGGGKYCSRKCFFVAHFELMRERGGFAKGMRWTHTEDYKRRLRLARTGKNNPMWRGGATKARNRIMNTHQVNKWRKEIFARDDWTCQECGRRCGDKEAHHIKFWCNCPELRLIVSNGVTLCKDCHKYVHRLERWWEKSLKQHGLLPAETTK